MLMEILRGWMLLSLSKKFYSVSIHNFFSIVDYLFKFLVIGSAGVGKSCILHHFIENKCKLLSIGLGTLHFSLIGLCFILVAW